MMVPNQNTRGLDSAEQELEAEILRLAGELHRLRQARQPPFQPGVSAIAYAGRVYDEKEIQASVKASLDFWLTMGPQGEAFERELGQFLRCGTPCWSTPAPARTCWLSAPC